MRDQDEALKPYHDVVIVGTGLVESILAAALTKVGKTVLHFEKHEYYGNDEWSTFDIPSILKWAELRQGPLPDNGWPGPCVTVPTPEAVRRQWPRQLWGGALLGRQRGEPAAGQELKVEGMEQPPAPASEDEEDDDKEKPLPPLDPSVPEECVSLPLLPKSFSSVRVLALHGAARQETKHDTDDQHSTRAQQEVEVPLPPPSSSVPPDAGATGGSEASPPPPPPPVVPMARSVLEERGRSFLLDVTPTVLLAAGDTVECLCSSGVANYMEFKAFEGLYVAAASSSSSSSAGTPPIVHKVPCSKADVFTSKLLSAKDKRQLMKMMQFVTDWGFKRTGKAPVTRNEVELGQGRSLHRPQNKGVVDLDADAFTERPFRDFLTHAKLDPHAQWVVTYALALTDEDQAEGGEGKALTTEEGLMQLFRHLNGLGRYGDTAFLWPVYGSNDFIHAFCRTSAVWGGTYVLRESISQLLLEPKSGRCLGVVDDTGAGLSCEAVIMGQDFLPSCRHTGRSVLKRITVLSGPLVGQGGEKRVGGLLPPKTVKGNNQHSIYFYQLDADTMVVPQGVTLLYLLAMLEEGEDRDMMDHALQVLLSRQVENEEGERPAEVWGITLEAPVLEPPDSLPTGEAGPAFPANVHFVPRTRPEFYLQSPMDQARELFHRICPHEAFLPAEVPPELAPYMPNLGTEDEDKDILESMSKQLLDSEAGPTDHASTAEA